MAQAGVSPETSPNSRTQTIFEGNSKKSNEKHFLVSVQLKHFSGSILNPTIRYGNQVLRKLETTKPGDLWSISSVSTGEDELLRPGSEASAGSTATHEASSSFRPVQTGSDLFELVQTGSDWSRVVQTGSDRSRLIQTGSGELTE